MLALPVMLLVFAIGGHLWAITWNAQYAHIKARYDVHEAASHKPCYANQGGDLGSGLSRQASATTPRSQFYGGRYLSWTQNRTMKAEYHIVCKGP